MMTRNDGRAFDAVRPIKIQYDLYGYADASAIFTIGETKVLVTATLQHGVPQFLKGKGRGWLTAEYAMLPGATRGRTMREASLNRRNSRNVEISRLIGRSFRAVCDLDDIGERTIILDCDVLQADGGTRVACISAANFVLHAAQKRWLDAGMLQKPFLKDSVAAISVGIINEAIYLDLAQDEDNNAHVDFNFVLTKSGSIIELQGTSEKAPMSWENFDAVKKVALIGVDAIFAAVETQPQAPEKKLEHRSAGRPYRAGQTNNRNRPNKSSKPPLFSLGNRLQS